MKKPYKPKTIEEIHEEIRGRQACTKPINRRLYETEEWWLIRQLQKEFRIAELDNRRFNRPNFYEIQLEKEGRSPYEKVRLDHVF